MWWGRTLRQARLCRAPRARSGVLGPAHRARGVFSGAARSVGKTVRDPRFLGREGASSIQRVALSGAPPKEAKQLSVIRYIQAFKAEGHLAADVEPLGLGNMDKLRPPFLPDQVASLNLETYGLSECDLESEFYIGDLLSPALEEGEHRLSDIVSTCRRMYCGTVGFQYMHIVRPDCKQWLDRKILSFDDYGWKPHEQEALLGELIRAALFEEFCGKQFSGAKRFSLEGGESLIPGLNRLLQKSCMLGISAIEIGMAHRGRLNVLHNVLKIPMQTLLYRFHGHVTQDSEHQIDSDDVRYHLGTSTVRNFALEDGTTQRLRISMAANPSHLESVNSVVLGKTRARQFLMRGERVVEDDTGTNHVLARPKAGSVDYSPSDRAKKQAMALLIHGDASFFQGSVRETMGFSGLRDYTTGGTVHVIVNNQIGFTTTPRESHSSLYCSDVALAIGAPVFHVNADDPEAVCAVFETAAEYRQLFGRDFVVNLWCYRRHGHNEQDTPELTQPLMYSKIAQHVKVAKLYGEKLSQSPGSAHQRLDADSLRKEILQSYETALSELSASENENSVTPLWSELGIISEKSTLEMLSSSRIRSLIQKTTTGVNSELLRSYGRAVFTIPEEISPYLHQHVVSSYHERLKSIDPDAGGKVKWATAEALAFASLLQDGFHVRLSGQDVERGTFTQRHAVVYDQKRYTGADEKLYKPWTALQQHQWHHEDVRRNLLQRANSIEIDGRLKKANSARGAQYAGPFEFPSDSEAVEERCEIAHQVDEIKDETTTRAKMVADTQELLKWRVPEKGHYGKKKRLGVMEVCNSPLSEDAVLGFEHGYSLYSSDIMAIWEAQFGDFSNCAQPTIDLFVASGEEKWARSSGVVLLLPHGWEGQGPDHSTGRMERFLQLCSQEDEPELPQGVEDEKYTLSSVNMHILNASTPAQYFHCLRRQMLLPVRKPLVIFSPKFLLHHARCVSSIEDMGPNTEFLPVLDDPEWLELRPSVRKVILCCGKMYYHLSQRRNACGLAEQIAIVRLEQLCPFPFYSLRETLERYAGAANRQGSSLELVWAQEEPKNMGAYTYVDRRVSWILHNLDEGTRATFNSEHGKVLKYRGRPPSASPATGSYEVHREEMQQLLNTILLEE